MKLGPISKLGKEHTTTLKQIGDGFMSTNCDIIVFIQFMAKWKRNSKHMVYKFIFRLIVTFYLTKLENSSHTIAWVKVFSAKKCWFLAKEC